MTIINGFGIAVALIMEHEGGYVNHPTDPGGETKYGISKRAYPHLSIDLLTREDAAQIYEDDYWEPVWGNRMPLGLAISVFDFAVNSGRRRAIRVLQKSVNALYLQKLKVDGVMGNKTLAAVLNNNDDVTNIIEEYNARRALFLGRLKIFNTFGLGWMRRVMDTYSASLKVV